jgi:hypothetical protein
MLALLRPRRGSSRASLACQWGWVRLAEWVASTMVARMSRRPSCTRLPTCACRCRSQKETAFIEGRLRELVPFEPPRY